MNYLEGELLADRVLAITDDACTSTTLATKFLLPSTLACLVAVGDSVFASLLLRVDRVGVATTTVAVPALEDRELRPTDFSDVAGEATADDDDNRSGVVTSLSHGEIAAATVSSVAVVALIVVVLLLATSLVVEVERLLEPTSLFFDSIWVVEFRVE